MDMSMTNVWLGILAVVSLFEFLMIAAAGFFAYRAYRQVMTVAETVERVHIAPLRARLDAILDEVQRMTAKLKHTQDSVGDAFKHVAAAGGMIADTVKAKSWPLMGIINGMRVAAGTLKSMKNGGKQDGSKHDDEVPRVATYGT